MFYIGNYSYYYLGLCQFLTSHKIRGKPLNLGEIPVQINIGVVIVEHHENHCINIFK